MPAGGVRRNPPTAALSTSGRGSRQRREPRTRRFGDAATVDAAADGGLRRVDGGAAGRAPGRLQRRRPASCRWLPGGLFSWRSLPMRWHVRKLRQEGGAGAVALAAQRAVDAVGDGSLRRGAGGRAGRARGVHGWRRPRTGAPFGSRLRISGEGRPEAPRTMLNAEAMSCAPHRAGAAIHRRARSRPG